jgi:5'-AMP-activated protein kinase regulatory beta subunit
VNYYHEQTKKVETFHQPSGERDYKNTSKIVHGFHGLVPLNSATEPKIPIIIVWSHPGKVVHLTGSFNNWQKKIRLQKSSQDFTTIVDMPVGQHQLKFIVDDEWKCSQDFPVTTDDEGNVVNYIQVVDQDGRKTIDGLQDILNDTISRPSSPIESYDCSIPTIEPEQPVPSLPSQLQKVLLNSKSISTIDPYILPVPNHVSINHLYACSIRDGIMAVSCTTRYRKKYISTVLYKPI